MLYKTFGPLHELYYIDIFQRITIQLLGEENEEGFWGEDVEVNDQDSDRGNMWKRTY